MSRAPSTFRQRDAHALIRAARTAGLTVVRVELGKDRRIVIVTSEQASDDDAQPDFNEWDRR
jgi:hypothetical protein